MGRALEITRLDLDASGLRREAGRSKSADAARRMLALAFILEGQPRRDAAESCGMDRQTLRDWVHRYNAEGLPGLEDRPSPGRPARLTHAQQAELAQIVRDGPVLAEHGVVRWRRIDLAAVIQAKFAVTLSERSVGAMLHRMNFRRLSVRPAHPLKSADAQDTYKKTSPHWLPKSFPPKPPESPSKSGSRTKRA